MIDNVKDIMKRKFEADLRKKEELRNFDLTSSQIFEDEMIKKELFYDQRDKFFRDKPGYKKIINSIGEEEWISEEELKKRDGYLNFEDDMEDAAIHQKRLLSKYFLVSFVIITLSLVVIFFLIENKGYIEISANKKGVEIFLDDELVSLTTGRITTIEDVVTGKHTIRLVKQGFKVNPRFVVVNVLKSDPKSPVPTKVEFVVDSIVEHKEKIIK
ncbi:MAG: hypothetical protein CR982_03605 [Candidatus Cloacimonadota bacterium]|nr:MAG: hypothetical protein CR982_03605 [Candidatus Cloacimonadota bacterium]